ncbi:MAG: L,D-transpeptidase family protein [Acidimicrobiales bacterium]
MTHDERTVRRRGSNWARRALPIVAAFGCLSGFGPVAVASATPREADLRVTSVSPSQDAKNVPGTSQIAIRFSSPISTSAPPPLLSPSVPGNWTTSGRLLVFTPTGAFPPDSKVTVTIRGGESGVVAIDGARLKATDTAAFTTEGGSVLRAEQLLAQLGYLPVTWHPGRPLARTPAEFERAVYVAPHGRFLFPADAPQPLRELWRPDRSSSQILQSALTSFDRSENLAAGSGLSGPFWSTLLRLGRRPMLHRNPDGFTYALVDKNVGNNRPETITIFQDGHVVLESPANTGIAASPTADGTYAVYLKFQNQVMSGVSPLGQPYSDPVSWISYFNGSDAVHYIYRAEYGFPQSFGCVELSWAVAERSYGLLQLGTLVTVES